MSKIAKIRPIGGKNDIHRVFFILIGWVWIRNCGEKWTKFMNNGYGLGDLRNKGGDIPVRVFVSQMIFFHNDGIANVKNWL